MKISIHLTHNNHGRQQNCRRRDTTVNPGSLDPRHQGSKFGSLCCQSLAQTQPSRLSPRQHAGVSGEETRDPFQIFWTSLDSQDLYTSCRGEGRPVMNDISYYFGQVGAQSRIVT